LSYLIRSIIHVMEAQYINLILFLRHRFRQINTYLERKYVNNETDLIHKLELSYVQNARKITAVSPPCALPHNIYSPFHTKRAKQSRLFEKTISFSRDQSTDQRQLLLMSGIHHVLCDLASCVDSMYGLQILVDFTVYFITITTSTYFCIRFIIQLYLQSEVTESEGVTRALSISVVWLSLVAIRLVAITASCSAASAEAHYSTRVLQRILLEPGLHPHTMRNAQLFLQQVTDRPVHFTAWGFFTINYTSLGSIVVFVATYLVILLQF
jgi:hypothetical protein